MDQNISEQQAPVERFGLIALLLSGISGLVMFLIFLAALALLVSQLFETEGMMLKFLIFAPVGFPISAGGYLARLRSQGALRFRDIALSILVCLAFGLLSGLAGSEYTHRKIRDDWPVICTVVFPALLLLHSFSSVAKDDGDIDDTGE